MRMPRLSSIVLFILHHSFLLCGAAATQPVSVYIDGAAILHRNAAGQQIVARMETPLRGMYQGHSTLLFARAPASGTVALQAENVGPFSMLVEVRGIDWVALVHIQDQEHIQERIYFLTEISFPSLMSLGDTLQRKATDNSHIQAADNFGGPIFRQLLLYIKENDLTVSSMKKIYNEDSFASDGLDTTVAGNVSFRAQLAAGIHLTFMLAGVQMPVGASDLDTPVAGLGELGSFSLTGVLPQSAGLFLYDPAGVDTASDYGAFHEVPQAETAWGEGVREDMFGVF